MFYSLAFSLSEHVDYLGALGRKGGSISLELIKDLLFLCLIRDGAVLVSKSERLLAVIVVATSIVSRG